MSKAVTDYSDKEIGAIASIGKKLLRAYQFSEAQVHYENYAHVMKNDKRLIYGYYISLIGQGLHKKFVKASNSDQRRSGDEYWHRHFYDDLGTQLLIPLIAMAIEYTAGQGALLLVAGQSMLNELSNPTEHELMVKKWYASAGRRDFIGDAALREKLWGELPQNSLDYVFAINHVFSEEQPLKEGIQKRRREYVTYTADCRVTTDVPAKYKNTVYFFGSSVTAGCGVEDRHTVPSYLQRLLNDQLGTDTMAVVNKLIPSGSIPGRIQHLLRTDLKEGDVVVIHGFRRRHAMLLKEFFGDNLNIIDCDLSNRPGNDEIFIDFSHVNYKGNKIVADMIFENFCNVLKKGDKTVSSSWLAKRVKKEERVLASNFLESYWEEVWQRRLGALNCHSGLKDYLSELSEFAKKPGKSGCIVMNCNPFTLGHRYLIEYSAARVDKLIVFVVEEDKSYFSFKDRYALVKKNTEDLENVTIVRSGRFILSNETFSEYFEKESASDVQVDATKDLDIFGEFIAKPLDIKIRFVGQEPICQTTRQYNEQMQKVLTQYGMVVEEIARKEVGNGVISASRVRALLKEDGWDEIRTLVPEPTYDYLRNRFVGDAQKTKMC